MKKIQEYTAQELFRELNNSSESNQIEAKSHADIFRQGKDGKSGRENYRSLMESICSFSNEPGLGGGVILLGVGEHKDDFFQRFSVEGITDTDKAQLDIATQCKEIFNIPVYDVDPLAIERYRTLRAKVNPSAEELEYNDQDLLEALGCVSSDNSEQLTLARVLLFGSYKLQRRVVPTMRIDYIRVPGNEWVEDPDASFRSIDMLGPLMLLVYRVVDAINSDLPKGFHLKEGELQAESTGLPVNVIREAVVNAMMHRSYRVDRPTQVIRYDNRIEIINAGYSLKDEGRYDHTGSEIRNRIIAPVFHDTNLAETKGSGIKRMWKLMHQANLATPAFGSDRENNTFTARFLLHHFLEEEDIAWLGNYRNFTLNEQQKTALIFIRETGAIDNLTYRQMNNCDTLKASKELRAMRDMALLDDHGRSSATYYKPGAKFISPKPYQAPGVSDQALPDDLQERLKQLKEWENDPQVIRKIIMDLCRVRPMGRVELARILKRSENYIKNHFLKTMIEDHSLVLTPRNAKSSTTSVHFQWERREAS